jgi:hypothetical protein
MVFTIVAKKLNSSASSIPSNLLLEIICSATSLPTFFSASYTIFCPFSPNSLSQALRVSITALACIVPQTHSTAGS